VTLALHHVRPVHARGGDSHQDFAFARRRHRLFLRHKHVGSARLADCNRSHGFGQTTVLHKRPLSIGDRINLSAADVTTGIEAAKNHLMQE
jgi:DNA topoisomerase IB